MPYLRIKELRKSKKLTQAEIAAMVGLSPSAIGMYEQGRREPDLQTLLNLAKTFGVTLDYLIINKVENTKIEDVFERCRTFKI